MGPSVKFVLAIVDAFSNKINGGQFFSPKQNQRGGGSEEGLAKDHFFSDFFPGNPYCYTCMTSNLCIFPKVLSRRCERKKTDVNKTSQGLKSLVSFWIKYILILYPDFCLISMWCYSGRVDSKAIYIESKECGYYQCWIWPGVALYHMIKTVRDPEIYSVFFFYLKSICTEKLRVFWLPLPLKVQKCQNIYRVVFF